MKNLFILGLTTVLFGCASRNYYQTDKWKNNNTITIKSENLKDFSIYIDGESIGIQKVDESNIIVTKYSKRNRPENIKSLILLNSSSDYKLTFDGFKNKDIKASLYNQNYEKIDLTIQKRIRYDALSKDLFCGIFTFGLPFLIDPFKSDFYRIKKSSLNHKVHFEYTQEYMKNEYVKIQSSTNISDFRYWLSNYHKSVIYQKVIDHSDSLEFLFAVTQQKESAIDDFISTHNNSKYLERAVTVKNEMKAAREMFHTAKSTNTIEALESFLNKFPNSLYVTEARKLLIDAAEKEAFSSLNSEKVLSYLKNYYIPNEIFLDKNIIFEKRKKIINNLEVFIFQESIINNQSKVYEEYSSLWKRYVGINDDNQIPSDIKNFEKIKNHQVEICDLLFNSLREANTSEKQSIWKEKSVNDFPKLDLNNNKPSNVKEILFTVLDNQKNGNGLINVFGSNYLLTLSEESKIDNGLISKFKSGKYEYKGSMFDALELSNYQELNFKEGIFSGISKAFKDNQLLFSFEANKKSEITDEISYYQNGSVVKKIFVSKGFLADGKCVINQEFSYEFENDINLSLKAIDEKIKQGNVFLKSEDFIQSISTFENARNNKFPPSIAQNIELDKCIKNAKIKESEFLKKEKEINWNELAKTGSEASKKLADFIAREDKIEKKNKLSKEKSNVPQTKSQQSTQISSSNNTSSPTYPGIYKCGSGSVSDYIKLNSNGTGKLYIDWVANEGINFTWQEYGDGISVSEVLTEKQKESYLIVNIPPIKYSVYNGYEILTLYHGMSGTEFVFVKQ
jgi:hypothetical protein